MLRLWPFQAGPSALPQGHGLLPLLLYSVPPIPAVTRRGRGQQPGPPFPLTSSASQADSAVRRHTSLDRPAGGRTMHGRDGSGRARTPARPFAGSCVQRAWRGGGTDRGSARLHGPGAAGRRPRLPDRLCGVGGDRPRVSRRWSLADRPGAARRGVATAGGADDRPVHSASRGHGRARAAPRGRARAGTRPGRGGRRTFSTGPALTRNVRCFTRGATTASVLLLEAALTATASAQAWPTACVIQRCYDNVETSMMAAMSHAVVSARGITRMSRSRTLTTSSVVSRG